MSSWATPGTRPRLARAAKPPDSLRVWQLGGQRSAALAATVGRLGRQVAGADSAPGRRLLPRYAGHASRRDNHGQRGRRPAPRHELEQALFSRLHRDDTALWQALAWLETHDVQVVFHGHTHVQMVHAWQSATNRLHTTTQQSQLTLQPATRYVVGVGSAGAPDDGPWLRYAIYDATAGTVLLRRLST